MRRTWGWWSVVLSALAVLAGAGGERPSVSDAVGASVSRHVPPSGSGGEGVVTCPHFRLGRGVLADGGRFIRDVRRTGSGPAIELALPTPAPARAVSCAQARPPSYLLDRSLRDGTRSSRSTGLPPPHA